MQLVLHGEGRFRMSCKPLNYLGPLRNKRLLVCGVGAEALGFAWAGADVYGFDSSPDQVQGLKDLARQLGLRDRTHLQPMLVQQLAHPDGYFDLVFAKGPLKGSLDRGLRELMRVMRPGARAAFIGNASLPFARAFGSMVQGDGWFGVEKREERSLQSHWSDLNRRPLDYESRALPLSYSGRTSDALARIRTATPFGTTPSR
jgi:SAM-dependent methyltransferase